MKIYKTGLIVVCVALGSLMAHAKEPLTNEAKVVRHAIGDTVGLGSSLGQIALTIGLMPVSEGVSGPLFFDGLIDAAGYFVEIACHASILPMSRAELSDCHGAGTFASAHESMTASLIEASLVGFGATKTGPAVATVYDKAKAITVRLPVTVARAMLGGDEMFDDEVAAPAEAELVN